MTASVTILLLDGEPMLRRATALMLASHGGRVSAAATPEEAVALSEGRLYDVAIFDISQPGPSAVDVLRRIRSFGLMPRRVIAVCDTPLDHGEAAEFANVLAKPYAFDRLLRAVFGGRGRTHCRADLHPRARAVLATRTARLRSGDVPRAPGIRGASRPRSGRALRGRG